MDLFPMLRQVNRPCAYPVALDHRRKPEVVVDSGVEQNSLSTIIRLGTSLHILEISKELIEVGGSQTLFVVVTMKCLRIVFRINDEGPAGPPQANIRLHAG